MKKYFYIVCAWAFAMIVLLSCGQNNKQTEYPTAQPYPSDKPVASYEEPELRLEEITEQEAIDFVETWAKIYATHTYDSYIKMYDRESFQGIKRTFSGEKNVYDYSGWCANKRAEFKKYDPEITIEDIKVKYLNQAGKSKVSFLQIWASPKVLYADRGEKILILKKINGEIIIEKEELLYSEPDNNYYGT